MRMQVVRVLMKIDREAAATNAAVEIWVKSEAVRFHRR
jgi:hypothetical protein